MANLISSRFLGANRLEVSALGFGAMALSGVYEEADENEAIKTVHRAIELGIRLIDTADFYTKGQRTADAEWGHNEKLIGRALKGYRDKVKVSTKVGAVILPDGTVSQDGRPEYIREAVEGSLQRLGIDHIDLYYLHRVDPKVPIEDTVGALGQLVTEGKVGGIGLSEASPTNIRKAHSIHPITAIQSEYSLVTRDPEQVVLPTCRELGIGFVPFASLGRGLLTGAIRKPEDMAENDWRRAAAPRFQSGNLERNIGLVCQLGEIADRLGVQIPQLALAWLLHQGDDIVPLFGAVTPDVLEVNVVGAHIQLDKAVVDEISSIFDPESVSGDRYPPAFMAQIDRD